MKVIIAGSRTITDYKALAAAITAAGYPISCVISGGARGADTLGEKYARNNNIPLKRYIPDWEKHGKSAGFLRNAEMVDNADGLIALWDGVSRGTPHTIRLAKQKGIPVYVATLPPNGQNRRVGASYGVFVVDCITRKLSAFLGAF